MADTETKTVETTERTVKEFASTKRNRLVFFALNLALVVPFVIHNYSPWGLGGAFAIMLLSYYLLYEAASGCTGSKRYSSTDVPEYLPLSGGIVPFADRQLRI